MSSQNNIYKIIQRLWIHIDNKRRTQFVFLFFLMFIASFLEILNIGAIIPFIGVLTSPEIIFKNKLLKSAFTFFSFKNANELLLPLTTIFIFLTIFSALFRIFVLWAQTKITFSIGLDLSNEIYKKTLYQPYNVHISRNSSDLIAGITTKSNSIISSALFPILTILSSVLMLIMILIALIYFSPVIAISSISSFGFIYFIIIKITRKRLSYYSKVTNQSQGHIIKLLQEGLGGIRDILLDGTQEIYCKEYRKVDVPLRQSQANTTVIAGSPRFIIEAFGMVSIITITYFSVNRLSGISMTIPYIGALALSAQRILPILQQAYASWTSIKSGQDSLKDALDLLEQPLNIEKNNQSLIFDREIIFNNVSFNYNDDTPEILSNINLKIKKGTKIGFIGETGSGKSTLLDIFMGLLTPTNGSIFIDDVEITKANNRSWQKYISHVPQSIYLTDSTIMENIAFGLPKNVIDFQKVELSANMAKISNSIKSWKDQYNTKVGERGVRISGGQRQRIGIARALYKNSEVIIFDEATSALDNDTEQEVMSEIEKHGKNLTIIIVAHRLSTLKNCDLIYEINKGKIIRQGKYNEIINIKNNNNV